MIEKILKFYNKNLTIHGLMTPGQKILLYFSMGISIICILFITAQQVFYTEYKCWTWLVFLFTILSVVWLMSSIRYIHRKIKKMKNIDDYDVYFSNELEKFLNKQNYIKVEDKIIGLLEDEARKIKEQFLSNYGVISGLYLIVFSCLCGKYYSISQTSTEVILTTIAFIILVFLLYQIIQGIKMISEMRYLSRNRLIIMMKENQIQRETNSNTNQIDDSFLTEKSVISKDNDSGLGCSEK